MVMCGRFVVKSDTEVVRDMFGDFEVIEQYAPSFNVAPSAKSPVLLEKEGAVQLRSLQWGLVPSFSKDPKTGFRMINARAETIHQLPSFRTPFRRRRCAVIADGFYEWRKLGRVKVPYYISLQSGRPMLFAGIYDHWKMPDKGFLSTFSIATVEANPLMAQIHNDKKRMPAIFSGPEAAYTWIDKSIEETDALLPLLKPLPAGKLRAHVVIKDAGSPANNRAELIAPAPDEYIAETYGEVPALIT